MTVLEAAQSGDEVAALEAMRDKLAADMDAAAPSVVAQVAARLESVLKRLGELQPSGKVTISDALAERRQLRDGRAESAAPARRRARQSAS